MQIPIMKSHLTPLERHQVRTLILKDAVALLSILFITALLAVVTHYLFNSYSDHREELANRWFTRGNAALQGLQPTVAINDFRSALLYAPRDREREMEIALASALASAGRIQEATAYFNTLREAEPGNGEINLQLARLAARAGNEDLAKQDFHAAIYGNWEGDGYLKRRSTRLELIRYLISRGTYEQARSELLVASGNAPSSDLEVQLTIAGLLVEARFPVDALELYRQLLAQHPESFTALQGAAESSYSIGDYAASYRYLQRALGVPAYANRSAQLRAMDQEQLHRMGRLLVLDPSTATSTTALATRLVNDREIAHKRMMSCLATQPAGPQAQSEHPPDATARPAGDGTGPSGLSKLGLGQLGRNKSSANKIAVAEPGVNEAGQGSTSGNGTATAMDELAGRWAAEPARLTVADLINDPTAQARERTLINDTELTTANACGAPSGDDAILLRLAQVPAFVPLQPAQMQGLQQAQGQPHE